MVPRVPRGVMRRRRKAAIRAPRSPIWGSLPVATVTGRAARFVDLGSEALRVAVGRGARREEGQCQ